MTHRNAATRRGASSKPSPRGTPNHPNHPNHPNRPDRPPRANWWTWWTAAPIAVVIIVVVALIAISAGSGPSPRVSNLSPGTESHFATGIAPGTGAVPATASVQAAVTSVSEATLRAVGSPTGLVGPTRITGRQAPLVGVDGKPEVVYVGAEYCPYCAAQRWAVAVALSRFGSFAGLETTHSSSSDIDPDTPTLSFYGSTYTSPVLDFVPVELSTNQVVDGRYPTLQRLTPTQASLLDTYDRSPYTSQPGAIPFIDIDNRFVMIGASYDPAVLRGASYGQVAAALSRPSSAIARAVDGTANLLVTAISDATGLRPNP